MNLHLRKSCYNIKGIEILNAQAGGVSGMSLSFNGWALKKRGPVFVSMFSPIGTVCSVLFSVFTLGDTINIGRFLVKIPSYYY